MIATLADPRRRGRAAHLRRLDRPRRLPALLRERLPDDDPARRRRRAGLHARAGRGALRRAARPGARLHRPQGRHVATTSPAFRGSATRPPGELIARYGSLEAVIEHAGELSPARSRAIIEHADQARVSKELATMRRDLDLDVDPAELVLVAARPLAAEGDLPPVRVPGAAVAARHARRSAAAQRPPEVSGIAGAAGARASSTSRGRVGVCGRRRPGGGRDRATRSLIVPAALDDVREARARDARCKVARRRRTPDDTLLMAYLIEPARSTYVLSDLGPEYGIELQPEPATDEETAALVVAAELPLLLAPLDAGPARRAQPHARCTARSSFRSRACSPTWSGTGVKIDTYRMGEITARLAERVAELEATAYERGGRGVHARLDPAGGAGPVREARA